MRRECEESFVDAFTVTSTRRHYHTMRMSLQKVLLPQTGIDAVQNGREHLQYMPESSVNRRQDNKSDEPKPVNYPGQIRGINCSTISAYRHRRYIPILVIVAYALPICIFFDSFFAWPSILFTGLITAALVGTAIRVGRYNTRCHEETILAAHVGPVLQKGELINEFDTVDTCSEVVPGDLRTITEKVIPGTEKYCGELFYCFILNSIRRHRSKTQLTIQGIFADEIDPFFDRHYNHLEYAAGISISLGILGTFAGMMLAITGDITVGTLMGGLHLSIGSSLVGIGSAVCIQVFTRLSVAPERLLREQYRDVALVYLLPAFQTSHTVDIHFDKEAVDEIWERFLRLLEPILESVDIGLTRLAERVDTLVSDFGVHNRSLAVLVGEFNNASSNWKRITLNVQETLSDLSEAFEQTHRSQKALAAEMRESQVGFESGNAAFRSVLDDLGSASKAMNDSLLNWVKYHPYQIFGHHLSAVCESSERLVEHIDRLDMTVGRHLDTFVDHAAAYWNGIEEDLKAHTGELRRFTVELKTLDGEMKKYVEKIGGVEMHLNTISEQLDKSESVEKAHARLRKQIRKEIYREYRNNGGIKP